MKTILYILLIASFLEIDSCVKRKLPPVEYVQWVENMDNGLKAEKVIGDYVFNAQYKPLEYIVLVDEKDPFIKKNFLDEQISQLDSLQYFNFKIALTNEASDILKHNLKRAGEFQARVEYFSFQIKDDFKLIDGSDTLKCILHHFERTFGLTPYCTFLLGFESSKKDNGNHDKVLIYNDHVFGNGPVKLTVTGSSLDKLPELQTL